MSLTRIRILLKDSILIYLTNNIKNMCNCSNCGCGCDCEHDEEEKKKDDQKKDPKKYTDDEEKMIKDKLKGLGYLD